MNYDREEYYRITQLQPSLKYKALPSPAAIEAKTWLQRTVRWVAQNWFGLRATATSKQMSVDYQVVTGRQLRDIVRQLKAVEAIYRGEVDRIVIGRDIMDQICEHSLEMPPSSFGVSMPTGGSNGLKILGIHVQYLPWFEGWMIIPKEANKK